MAFSGGSLAATEIARLRYTINYEDGATQRETQRRGRLGGVALPAGTEELFNAGPHNLEGHNLAGDLRQQHDGGPMVDQCQRIVLENTTANILSIDFGPVTLNNDSTPLNSGDDVVVWGVAGEAVPEPSVTALALAALPMTLGASVATSSPA